MFKANLSRIGQPVCSPVGVWWVVAPQECLQALCIAAHEYIDLIGTWTGPAT